MPLAAEFSESVSLRHRRSPIQHAASFSARLGMEIHAPPSWSLLATFSASASAHRASVRSCSERAAICATRISPLPFDKSARIEVVSDAESGQPVRFDSEVIWSSDGRQKEEGRFYALWHRENPTTPGGPFTLVETEGGGHLVGVALQAQGLESGQTLFFEGDDQTTLDGELTIHGTGSEDFFNGGWYDVPGRWYGRVSFPLSGSLDYVKPAGRTGGYRWMIADSFAFHKSLRMTIEHGPEGNLVPTDYTSVAYLYLDRHPSWDAGIAEPAKRAIRDPDRLIFVPGWNQPVFAFSMQNLTLTRREVAIGKTKHRVLSAEGHGSEVFGPHYVAFSLDIPRSGDYDVSVEGLRGPGYGTAQILVNDVPAGKQAQFEATELAAPQVMPLTTLHLNAGLNHVFFRLLPAGSKEDRFRVDLVRIVVQPRTAVNPN